MIQVADKSWPIILQARRSFYSTASHQSPQCRGRIIEYCTYEAKTDLGFFFSNPVGEIRTMAVLLRRMIVAAAVIGGSAALPTRTQDILHEALVPELPDFGVGFDLTASYG